MPIREPECLRDLPLKRQRDQTRNKIKYKQQALITTKIHCLLLKSLNQHYKKHLIEQTKQIGYFWI